MDDSLHTPTSTTTATTPEPVIRRPRTLREKYSMELDRLYEQLDAINGAAATIMERGIASLSLGNRSVSYTSLDSLWKIRRDTEGRIEELEALLSGRPVRNVQTNAYLSPSVTVPRTIL